ncbi:MAG: hypothetical protein PUE85_05115 [Firmicutes bacterium]|nr:hypothetical protein [Bacillota bacterium]
MRYFLLSSDAERFALLMTMFITVCFLIILMFVSSGKRKQFLSQIINIAMLAVVFVFLVLTYSEHRNIQLQITAARHLFVPMPALWAFSVIFCTHAVCVIIARFRRRKKKIYSDSIREALNTLPAAVCYFDKNGLVKLCNLNMYRLYHEMTNSNLQTLEELHEALDKCSKITAVKKISDENPVWLFQDGRYRMFSEKSIEANDGKIYAEAIFYDVTELYNKKLELKNQEEQLKEVNENIRILTQNIAAITKEEEMLFLKTKLHDRLGAGIVAARQAILLRRSSAETEGVIRMWREAIAIVNSGKNVYPAQSGLNELLRDAKTIGINIITDGIFPDGSESAEVFLCAIQECLTNCARHAGGNELYVTICNEAGKDKIIIKNNGKAPDKEIRPGGGLINLQKMVSRHGGIMEIQSLPEFKLTITIGERRGADDTGLNR